MEDNYNLKFKINSANNQYLIEIKIINNDLDQKKLEISLIHKIKNTNIEYFAQYTKESLINENNILSQFKTIEEIYDYLIKFIMSKQFQIVKPSLSNYYIYFFNEENKINFQILIPKKLDEKKEIMKLKQEIESYQKKLDDLESKVKEFNDDERSINNSNNHNDIINNDENKINDEKNEKEEDIMNNLNINNNNNNIGKCVSTEILQIKSEGPSYNININQSSSSIKETYILKENNNYISFKNAPKNFEEEKIISSEKEQCETFTAFMSKNENSIIVWTIKGYGIINLYDFKKDIHQKEENAHTGNINCVQYFHDRNAYEDYIISLSKLDDTILKIWKIDDENDNKLILSKEFQKNYVNMNIEVFCIFNYTEYNKENSFLFIYGNKILKKKNNKYDYNISKNKEINVYKLNEDLNIITWEKDDNMENEYEIINNFYKINYLDTYYDFETKKLYLINCNENDIEVITELFNINRGTIFKYKDWGSHLSAFIKEIKSNKKLFDLSIKGIAIWNINNIDEPEAIMEIQDFCPFDLIAYNDDYLIVSGDKKLSILKIKDNNIKRVYDKNKKNKYTKVRKISLPNNSKLIVAIDDYKVKYWNV